MTNPTKKSWQGSAPPPPFLAMPGFSRLLLQPPLPYQPVLLKLDTIHTTSHWSIGFGITVQSVFWASRRRRLPWWINRKLFWTNQILPLMIHMFWPGFPFPFPFTLDQWEKIAALALTVRRGCNHFTQALNNLLCLCHSFLWQGIKGGRVGYSWAK